MDEHRGRESTLWQLLHPTLEAFFVTKLEAVEEVRIHPTPIFPFASPPLIYDKDENISPLWYRKKVGWGTRESREPTKTGTRSHSNVTHLSTSVLTHLENSRETGHNWLQWKRRNAFTSPRSFLSHSSDLSMTTIQPSRPCGIGKKRWGEGHVKAENRRRREREVIRMWLICLHQS